MHGDNKSESAHAGGAEFPSTLWSVVVLTGETSNSESEQALARLCSVYWKPLYAFIRREGYSPPDAQDLTQGFFAHLLDRHRLGRVDRSKGKFRSFLLASLRNFLADQRDKAQAIKRGGQVSIITLDLQNAEEEYIIEPVDPLTPEKLFERRWMMTVLQRVLDRLEGEYGARGLQERFARLQQFLLGDDGAATYSEVGNELGMSESAVKMAVLRLRQRSRELFREEIAATVASDEDVEEEVRQLSALLGS
jgi:RNA polymerase sigma factor (sigma-70 family)